jgi:trans-4-hydroxy-L-proline dehydratase
MTERVQQLRKQSLEAINRLDHERAFLVTKFYREMADINEAIPIQRSRCFSYILENKKIYTGKGELIVGERGPAPKATSTFPEVNLHSMEDLEILSTRPKVSFAVSEETKSAYRDEIIPFWEGRTNRDKLMALMSPSWKTAYEAGVFTEFQEQRAPGHTVLGRKLWSKGMLDLIEECNEELNRENAAGGTDIAGINELNAMKIAAQALITLADRHSTALEQLAAEETETDRRNELHKMAEICRRVPANAPLTFHEALQHYWFIHLGVITELNPWDSFNPGRLDQYLISFYLKEIKEGSLTKEKAKEILQCFWIKFNNHPAPPKMGITASESNTYTDFTLVNLGGVKEDGSDAVNELSYLILEVIKEMRLLQPGSMIQVSRKNPDHFIHKALDIIRTGFGQPSVFNTDGIVQQLVRQGKTIEDARNGGASGCVETGAFGTEAYILTGYFNLVKILELTLNNGFDRLTSRQIGPETGDPSGFGEFNELMQAFETQLKYFADIKIDGNLKIEKLFSDELPVPFLSLLTDDCIENRKDYNSGGARYNTSYIQGVGLGSVTDSLTSLRYHVFDRKNVTMREMLQALEADFNGFDKLREMLVFDTPKYGNDDDYADHQAVSTFNIFLNAIDGRPCFRGGKFRINLLPTTCHIYFGSVTGAMPDGRKSRKPLSEGISPVQGADCNGPTAVLKSASKIDHLKTGGTLLNQKFTPSFFEDSDSYSRLTALIRSWFRMNGHHIQFNVVSARTLRDAQKHPENYRDLIVRVAGYSDYFNDLGRDLQEEIIIRTEQGI